MATDSKLRGCDLVRMQVVDVVASGQIKERASVLQSKTQKPVRFEISEGTRASVAKWMEDPLMVGSEYLWPGRFSSECPCSWLTSFRIITSSVLHLEAGSSDRLPVFLSFCQHGPDDPGRFVGHGDRRKPERFLGKQFRGPCVGFLGFIPRHKCARCHPDDQQLAPCLCVAERPAKISLLRPVARMASSTRGSSHALTVVRSMKV